MLLVDPKKLGAVSSLSQTLYTSAVSMTLSPACPVGGEGGRSSGRVIHKGSALAFTPHTCALSSQLQGPPASWNSQK